MTAPLKEWVVSWPSSRELRDDVARPTLYVTLEPSCERKGETLPPITQLIEQSGIPRVVIGCPDPIPEGATEGAATLHSLGVIVSLGVEEDACKELIVEYAERANGKLQKMAGKWLAKTGQIRGQHALDEWKHGIDWIGLDWIGLDWTELN